MKTTTFNPKTARNLGTNDLPEVDFWLNRDEARCRLVKQNSKRSVYAISREADEKPIVYLKHDHPQGPRDRGKQIIRPKVRYEYLHTRELFELGLPIVKPLFAAWNLVEGIFVSEALDDSRDASAVWAEVKSDRTRRDQFMSGLQKIINLLFDACVFHPDFHLGNLLCRDRDEAIDFFLVDCFGVRQSDRLSRRKRNVMLLIIFQLHDSLTEMEMITFLKGLSAIRPEEDLSALLHGLRTLGNASFYKRWPKRKRKLMRTSGFSTCHRDDAGVWRVNRRSSLELSKRIIAEHGVAKDAGGDALLKDGKKRCVTAPAVNGNVYIVKEFFAPGPWGSLSADARCWLNNWGLAFCGLPCPPVHAWFRSKDGHGYVVSEFVSGSSAYHALSDALGDEPAFDEIAASVYSLVRQLYRSGVMHEDLKLNNMILNDGKLWLIDNDAVLFDVTIEQRHWDRNLKHLVRDGTDAVFEKLNDYLSKQPLPFG